MLAETFGVDWLRVNLPFPCEIHWCWPMSQLDSDRYKVLVLHMEPAERHISLEALEPIHQHFDLIVASDERFLKFPNAVKSLFGGIWVTKVPSEKEFSASFIYSAGMGHQVLPGYVERANLSAALGDIQIPMRVYKGKRAAAELPFPLLENDLKNCLFRSMFHVTIENIRETDYFSEKLIDCFATFTVPIYLGCPNIGDHFDTRGIIQVETQQELIAALNRLTVMDYWSRLPALHANFERAQAHKDILMGTRNVILRHRQAQGLPHTWTGNP